MYLSENAEVHLPLIHHAISWRKCRETLRYIYPLSLSRRFSVKRSRNAEVGMRGESTSVFLGENAERGMRGKYTSVFLGENAEVGMRRESASAFLRENAEKR